MALSKLRDGPWPLGAVASGAVEAIPPGAVQRLFDAFWSDEGLPVRRGGSSYKSAALGSGGPKWIADKRLVGGQRTAFPNTTDMSSLAADDVSFYTVNAADPIATVMPVVVRGRLFYAAVNAGNYMCVGWGGSRKANYAVGTVTVTKDSTVVTGVGTAWLANIDPGMLFETAAGAGTVSNVVSDTSLTLADPWAFPTAAGVVYGLKSVATTNAGAVDPVPIAALGSVAGRLVVARGTQAAFSPLTSTQVAWDPTDVHPFPAGVLGFGNIRDTLVAFTTEGTFAVYNMALDLLDAIGNPQQRLERINDELILWGQFGIANWQGSLIVPMLDGVYLVDTVGRPQKISGSFEDVYMAHVRAGNQPGGAAVFNGRYMLPILSSAGVPQDLLTCRLTPNSAGRAMLWSQARGHGGGSNVRALAVRAPSAVGGTPLLLAAGEDGRISVLHHFEPQAAYKADADGGGQELDIRTRAFETGGGVRNTVRFVTVHYELLDAAADDPSISVGFAVDGAAAFTAAAGAAAESTGTIAKRTFVVNKLARVIQFQIHTQGPGAASAKIHGLEMQIRPSGRA